MRDHTLHARALTIALVSLTVALAGCKDDNSISVEQLPRAVADHSCDQLERCTPDGFVEAFIGPDCRGTQASQFENSTLGSLQASIDAGRVEYNAGAVGACLDALTAGCTFSLGGALPPECDDALVGSVAIGGDCNDDIECAGAAYCEFGLTCPGSCTALKSLGYVCFDDNECAYGLTCSGLTCRSLVADGERCGASVNAACESLLAECQGLPGQQRCVAEFTFDAVRDTACDPDNGRLCEEGSVCAITSLGMLMEPVWECIAPFERSGNCNVAFPNGCPEGQYCAHSDLSFTGSCADLPTAGQPCVDEDGLPDCAAGFRCDELSDSCVAMKDNGAQCTGDEECWSDYCNPMTSFCEEQTCSSP